MTTGVHPVDPGTVFMCICCVVLVLTLEAESWQSRYNKGFLHTSVRKEEKSWERKMLIDIRTIFYSSVEIQIVIQRENRTNSSSCLPCHIERGAEQMIQPALCHCMGVVALSLLVGLLSSNQCIPHPLFYTILVMLNSNPQYTLFTVYSHPKGEHLGTHSRLPPPALSTTYVPVQ